MDHGRGYQHVDNFLLNGDRSTEGIIYRWQLVYIDMAQSPDVSHLHRMIGQLIKISGSGGGGLSGILEQS